MTVLKRAPLVAAREDEGEYLLYDGVMLQLLSGPAARVWELVDGTREASEIADLLAERHPGDATRVRADVLDFCADLLRRQVVVEAAPDGIALPADHVGWVEDGSTALLVDLQTGTRRALTASGRVVWEAVLTSQETDVVLQQVRDSYPDASPELEHDVAQLIEELTREGFLRRG